MALEVTTFVKIDCLMLCKMTYKRYKELKNIRPGDFIVEYDYDVGSPRTFIVIQNVDDYHHRRGLIMHLTLLGRSSNGDSKIYHSRFSQDRLFNIVNIDEKSK